MTEQKLPEETKVRRFLLGEMSLAERTAFEERFLGDEGLFDQIRVVEDELIELYVRDTLPAVDRKKFESVLLSTGSGRARVAFSRSMLDHFAAQKRAPVTTEPATSLWRSIRDLFITPRFAFGAAFALLVLLLGGWLLFMPPPVREPEISLQNTPTPATVPDQSPNVVAPNTNVAVNVPSNRKVPANTSPRKPSSPVSIPVPVLALFAGNVRSGGSLPELDLPDNADGAQLQLNLESQDYTSYLIEIDDQDGNPVARQDRLSAKSSRINVYVPTRNLRRGDYIVRLSALNAENKLESVADFPFRVKR